MNEQSNQDFSDELDMEIFQDFQFDVEPSKEAASQQQNYASAPIYVKSIGRGKRKMLNPLDIPLPWQYYEELEKKKTAAAAKSSASTKSVAAASLPGRSRDHRTVKAPLQEEVSHRPGNRSKVRGRGRGRALEEGLTAMQQKKLPVVQIRDLGKAGLPQDIANVEQGKARLMQMFLGQESQFEENSSDSSVHSAPTYNLKNDLDFPRLITGGVPFKASSSSLDENVKGGRRKPRIVEGGVSSVGPSSGNRVDKTSSSGDTAERSGNRSSGGEDLLDFEGEERRVIGNDDNVQVNGIISLHGHNGSSSNSQVMEGPNVLELMNLPPDLTRENLGDLLMGCGNIIEMRILRDPDTEQCIGLAYVRMETEDACLMAAHSYNAIESPFVEMYGEEEVPKLIVRLQGS